MAGDIKDVTSALKVTGWRTQEELYNMTTEDERNTLIVELHKHSNLSIPKLQAKRNTGNLDSLTGMAAICYFLYSNSLRKVSELKSMSDEDQRNTLIVELNKKVKKGIRELQGMSDLQLVALGVEFYRTESTVTRVLGIRWHISAAKITDQIPELLEQRTYDNRKSSEEMHATYSYRKTITKETSFEHSRSLNFNASMEYGFKAGVPKIVEKSGKITVQIGGEISWKNATKDTVEEEFTKTATIRVRPGGHIRCTSTITVGRMDVPYTMELETKNGRKTTVDGVWHGVTLFNLQEKQEDVRG